MSCRELERLFVAGSPDSEQKAHRASCAECAHLGADLDSTAAFTSGLRVPTLSPQLRQALLRIPSMTVNCEGAEMLLASALEGEIAKADESRLQSHLSRCGGCTQAAQTLYAMRELVAPEPPPWLATRLVAAKPEKKKSFWRRAFSGKLVITYAYSAAVIVMLLGLNPTAVVRRTGFASLGESTRNAVTVAESSVGDRLGALQEKALRTLAVWRGHVGGYGRAAVSNALAIVWKPESSKKAPSRPRLGKEGGAAAQGGDFQTAGAAKPEPLPSQFRV
jgi:hypothetical protein